MSVAEGINSGTGVILYEITPVPVQRCPVSGSLLCRADPLKLFPGW